MKMFMVIFLILSFFLVFTTAIAVFIYLMSRTTKSISDSSIPAPDENGATDIKIISAFQGYVYLPRLMSIARNSANPKLVLTNTGITYKVMTTQTKTYDQIKIVDTFSTIGTEIILFRFTNSKITFSANLLSRDRLCELLKILQTHHLPLSAAAQKLLASHVVAASYLAT